MKSEELARRTNIACQGDIELLRRCLVYTNAGRVVMIGSGLGVLSAAVMEYSSALLFSIDIDPHDRERENLERVGLWDPGRIRKIIGDSAELGHQYFFGVDGFPKLFDVIVIDGGHEREQVEADIEAWVSHLREGGIMFFHDYRAADAPMQHPGVGEAVDESEVHEWLVYGRQGWSIAFAKPES